MTVVVDNIDQENLDPIIKTKISSNKKIKSSTLIHSTAGHCRRTKLQSPRVDSFIKKPFSKNINTARQNSNIFEKSTDKIKQFVNNPS